MKHLLQAGVRSGSAFGLRRWLDRVRCDRRRLVQCAAFTIALTALGPGRATAAPIPVSSTTMSPFAGCAADHVATQRGVNVLNSEVEPFVAVNPTNASNVVAVWQQDRWAGAAGEGGGSRGLVVATSFDGGLTWTTITGTKGSLCTGGVYDRASDPWLSFGPGGRLYLMTLALDEPDGRGAFGPTAMLASTSTDGGLSWSDPATLIRDDNPNVNNDKNSITADPNDQRYAYAVWHRLVVASETASPIGGENVLISSALAGASGYRAPTWFTRTTDGGATWEAPRPTDHFGEGVEAFAQQISVLPDNGRFAGELVMLLVRGYEQENGPRGIDLAIERSADHGETWSRPVPFEALDSLSTIDPLTRQPIRAGRFIPDVAVDRRDGALYAVWTDGRFSGFRHNDIALSMSTDGGLIWTDAVRVNLTPAVPEVGDRQAFTPSVAVGRDGTVTVGYYDLRNNGADATSSDPLETDYFAARCRAPAAAEPDRCADAAGWTEARITLVSFDLRTAVNARGLFLGDYVGLDGMGNGFASLIGEAHGPGDPSSAYFSSVP